MINSALEPTLLVKVPALHFSWVTSANCLASVLPFSDLLDTDVIRYRFIKCEYQILTWYVTHKIILRTKRHYLYKTIRTAADT